MILIDNPAYNYMLPGNIIHFPGPSMYGQVVNIYVLELECLNVSEHLLISCIVTDWGVYNSLFPDLATSSFYMPKLSERLLS